MSEIKTKNIVTPEATLSYPWLDVPQESEEAGKKPKYSGAFVFAKGANLSELKAAVTAVAEAKWPGKSAKMFESGSLRNPFRYDGEKKGYPAGSVFFNARSEQKPGCVYAHAGPNGKPETIPADKIRDALYAGAKVRGSVTAFAYDAKGNKGVSFALNNVQKVGEGYRLDNRLAAEDEFDADLSAAPADLDAMLK